MGARAVAALGEERFNFGAGGHGLLRAGAGDAEGSGSGADSGSLDEVMAEDEARSEAAVEGVAGADGGDGGDLRSRDVGRDGRAFEPDALFGEGDDGGIDSSLAERLGGALGGGKVCDFDAGEVSGFVLVGGDDGGEFKQVIGVVAGGGGVEDDGGTSVAGELHGDSGGFERDFVLDEEDVGGR